MPHHPQGDQKLLQLETLLDTEQGPQKGQWKEKRLDVWFYCLSPNLTIFIAQIMSKHLEGSREVMAQLPFLKNNISWTKWQNFKPDLRYVRYLVDQLKLIFYFFLKIDVQNGEKIDRIDWKNQVSSKWIEKKSKTYKGIAQKRQGKNQTKF